MNVYTVAKCDVTIGQTYVNMHVTVCQNVAQFTMLCLACKVAAYAYYTTWQKKLVCFDHEVSHLMAPSC